MDKNSQNQDLDLESVSIPDTIRNISPAKLQQTFVLRNLTSYMKIVSVLAITYRYRNDKVSFLKK